MKIRVLFCLSSGWKLGAWAKAVEEITAHPYFHLPYSLLRAALEKCSETTAGASYGLC